MLLNSKRINENYAYSKLIKGKAAKECRGRSQSPLLASAEAKSP